VDQLAMSVSSSWGKAFRHARETEAEGAQYFEGFFKKAKIVLEGSTSTIVDQVQGVEAGSKAIEIDTTNLREDAVEGVTIEETDDVERGGFCQPAGLAKFFASTKCPGQKDSLGSIDGVAQVTQGASAAASDVTDSVERESGATRQICRAWLKNTFLQLGQPCKNASCERRHLIESRSIGSLYKDYSFKGLTAVQRSSIISQVQASAVMHADSATSDKVVEVATEADIVQVTKKSSDKVDKVASKHVSKVATDKKTATQTEVVVKDAILDLGGVTDSRSSSVTRNNVLEVESITNEKLITSSKISRSGSKKRKLYVLNGSLDLVREQLKSSLKSLSGKCLSPWMPVHRRITY
jgi:hypothetical protein